MPMPCLCAILPARLDAAEMKAAVTAVVATVKNETPVRALAPTVVGRTSPGASGRSLAGESVRIPEALAGLRAVVARLSGLAGGTPGK